MEHETFWTLMCSLPHWEFEIFLMLVVDGLLGALILPLFKRWIRHHRSDDDQLATLQKQVKSIQDRLGIKTEKTSS
jgi:uncharacterized membrane-anchored protein YhcB (DUF1043 family)